MERFTPNVLHFLIKTRQNVAFGWANGQSPSNPKISGIFLKFPNELRSEVLSRLATREATRRFTFW